MADETKKRRQEATGEPVASPAEQTANATPEAPVSIGRADVTAGQTTRGQPTIQQQTTPSTTGSTTGLGGLAQQLVQQNQLAHVDTSGMENSINQQYAAAERQAQNQIDYATGQGINELSRTQQDAQEQYQTQYNQIDRDEARARDNQALYAAARGDRGGIGAAQYDAIANNTALNRNATINAQTKLATDTMRQMADLRAQGEFQKADAALQIMRARLSELRNLQLTALQMNLSIDQYNTSLAQWAADYMFQVQQANISASQFMEQMAFQRERAERADYESDRAYNYQVGRDAVADAQWQKQFEESVRQFGLNYGLSERQIEIAIDQFNRNLAFQQQQTAIENARADRQIANQEKQQAWSNAFTEKQFAYGQQRDTVSDQQWERSFAANRQDAQTAAQQWLQQFIYQQQRDTVSDQQWEKSFAANRADTAWNQNYQLNRDAISDARYADETNYNRNINERNYQYQVGQDAIANARADRQEQQNAANTARNNVYNKLQMGIMPTTSELSAAGVSSEEARNYISNVNAQNQAATRTATAQAGSAEANEQLARFNASSAMNPQTAAQSAMSVEDLATAALLSGTSTPQTWLNENYKNAGYGSKPNTKEFTDAMSNLQSKISSGQRNDIIADFEITNHTTSGGYIDVANKDGNGAQRLGLSRIQELLTQGRIIMDVDYQKKTITYKWK